MEQDYFRNQMIGRNVYCYVDCYDRYMFWRKLSLHCNINIKAFVYDTYTPIRLLGLLNKKIQIISDIKENSILLVWNNCSKYVSKQFDKILYFEVCNLGNNVYFDDLGVNCHASFVNKRHIHSEINEKGYYTLKNDAISFFQTLEQTALPESYPNPRKRYVVQKLLNILNFKNIKKLIFFLLSQNWYLKTKLHYISQKQKINNGSAIIILQTRNDTSLIDGWSSDYDTLIKDLVHKYDQIYIRPHPEDLLLALDLSRNWPNHVKIAYGDFNQLYGHQYIFYTVCSSAGLKLCLGGEKVKFLGASYFMVSNSNVKSLAKKLIK